MGDLSVSNKIDNDPLLANWRDPDGIGLCSRHHITGRKNKLEKTFIIFCSRWPVRTYKL